MIVTIFTDLSSKRLLGDPRAATGEPLRGPGAIAILPARVPWLDKYLREQGMELVALRWKGLFSPRDPTTGQPIEPAECDSNMTVSDPAWVLVLREPSGLRTRGTFGFALIPTCRCSTGLNGPSAPGGPSGDDPSAACANPGTFGRHRGWMGGNGAPIWPVVQNGRGLSRRTGLPGGAKAQGLAPRPGRRGSDVPIVGCSTAERSP
jgi:hypothetical protein